MHVDSFLSRRERNAPLQVTDNKENNSGAARPLRFSACVWRDLKSLMSSCLCFEMDRTLISLGFLISSRIFQANSFTLSIWMRAISSLDGIFRSRHRTSLFSVHLADPPFCLIACRRSRTSHTQQDWGTFTSAVGCSEHDLAAALAPSFHAYFYYLAV